MWNEFVLVSGWFFWIALAIVLALEIVLLSVDAGKEESVPRGWVVFIAMATLIGVVLFTDALEGVRLRSFIIGLVVYLILGVAWSFKKWYFYVVKKRDVMRESWKRDSAKETGIIKPWEVYVKEHSYDMPTAAKNKALITSWMALWPFSFTWWALTWPRKLFCWLYEKLSTVYDRVTAKIYE